MLPPVTSFIKLFWHNLHGYWRIPSDLLRLRRQWRKLRQKSFMNLDTGV
jgi:hypothetical protein